MKRLLFSLLLLTGLAFATVARAAEDVRFTRTLAAEEISASGLDQLDSDQLAVLDALVRRDIAATRFVSRTPRAKAFSARLSADELRNSGLDRLTAKQRAQLDQFAARVIPADDEDGGASANIAASSGGPTPPIGIKVRRGPEFHGFVSLFAGWGSGNYSEIGGAVYVETNLTPSLTVGVGYAESRIKGDYLPCDYYDPRWDRRHVVDRALGPIR
ncbi:MAG: hypothetical protein NVV63_01215 [Opitutus sp.]|nr:hypothetical protein [Opitutus sp.]